MSWAKSLSYSGEDVFDDDADDLSLQRKEWTSNMKKRVRDGFVDGVDAGEEAALQAGFNLGFRAGAAQTVAAGRLKGIISAVWCWFQIQHPENPVPASVTDLLELVTQHENAKMERIKEALENPPPSVSEISESMEDLEVDQTNASCCGEGCNKADCLRNGEKMDVGIPHPPQKPRPGSGGCSFGSGESLDPLLERCIDLVKEFGLPQELISHIQDLKQI